MACQLLSCTDWPLSLHPMLMHLDCCPPPPPAKDKQGTTAKIWRPNPDQKENVLPGVIVCFVSVICIIFTQVSLRSLTLFNHETTAWNHSIETQLEEVNTLITELRLWAADSNWLWLLLFPQGCATITAKAKRENHPANEMFPSNTHLTWEVRTQVRY